MDDALLESEGATADEGGELPGADALDGEGEALRAGMAAKDEGAETGGCITERVL